jgi:antitoxin HicB
VNRLHMAKNAEGYLSLPYTFTLRKNGDDNIFVARVAELPGCSAHGDTEQEALNNLRGSMQVWIEDCLEAGDPVPEPARDVDLPSGKWVQRVPRSLHLKLIRLARREGVSLNQLVTSALAEAVGSKGAVILSGQGSDKPAQSSFSCWDWTPSNRMACNSAVNPYIISTQHYDADLSASAFEILVQELAGSVGVAGCDQTIQGRRFYAESKKPLLAGGR